MRGQPLERRKYIAIVSAAAVVIIAAVCIYLAQLSSTVAGNLMTSVDEISRHDVETIEGTLENCYARLGSVAERLEVYGVQTVHEAQEQLNLEAASSAMFNAVYLMEADGTLYSSSYVRFNADEHAYDELMEDGRDRFAMLYDDEYGRLETTKESLIFGIRLPDVQIGGHTFVGMLGRSDLSTISSQLVIESFNGQGVSSVVNARGYYIVSASPATDLAGRDNFYDMLEAGRIDDGVTVEDIRRNIAAGESFVINCTTSAGEDLVMSFAPVAGTEWSFIMAVPTEVFNQRFAPFIAMTVGMLGAMVVVISLMLAVIYRFMRQSIQARAEAVARTEFLSNMSHEIRTPLNGIIGLNHLMERHVDDAAVMRDYVGRLGKAAQYLLSLVNDILDVSKLQAGKVDLANEPFDLNALVDNVCEMQRGPMAERGINFELSRTVEHPWLLGDEVRLSQVLMNILSNAVKFTPEGGRITVRVHEAVYATGDKAVLTVSIADTGCGMTKEFAAHVFDAFTQERNRNSDSQKGTGLGMSISHLLVTQMGGSITVESEPGCGSCFTITVTLPTVANGDESAQARVQAPSPVSPSAGSAESIEGVEGAERGEEEGVKPSGDAGNASSPSDVESAQAPIEILVAEDNELNADIISSILTEEGFSITVAENGEEAVRLFSESPEGHFAAILMDAQMPVMDGYEASREIRHLKRADAKKVRIFACTASTFTEDRNRALESGMDDFLTKPLNVAVMLEKLEVVRKGRVS